MNVPDKLQKKIEERQHNNLLRSLGDTTNLIDFSSNDYLGLSKSKELFVNTHHFLAENLIFENGATGSRLLSGNHSLYTEVEEELCQIHHAEAALLFNSGYTANLGFFSSVPLRGDIILYDELIHASIRDGIQLSNAKSYKFKHNDVENLAEKLAALQHGLQAENQEIYVVTESVFSMDGDMPNLLELVNLCEKYKAYLIVDEAHALGVLGNKGLGLVQDLQLENKVFARIITFGKALGCHGAVVLGSKTLIQFLVNFSRSFIYTTALPPHALATIKIAYDYMLSVKGKDLQKDLHENISYFLSETKRLEIRFIPSKTAIHCCVISGNTKTRDNAKKLQDFGFDVKPILSPTVPEGKERLRFCLHSFNSKKEITQVLEKLSTFV